MLQDFFHEGRLLTNKNKLVANINELTRFGRDHHIPIIWVRQEFKENLSDAFLADRKAGRKITIENTPGSKLLPELAIDATDHTIIKKRYSAFFNTNLDQLLAQLNADLLIFAGINTHACIRVSVIDAYQRDYEVILAADCIDSYDEEHHNISVNYLTKTIASAKTNKEILQHLSNLNPFPISTPGGKCHPHLSTWEVDRIGNLGKFS